MFALILSIQGLEIPNTTPLPRLRPHSETSSERTSSYRFSMANLEETHEAELDAILGELSMLEQRNNTNIVTTNNTMNGSVSNGSGGVENLNVTPINGDSRHGRTHSRSNSIISGVTNASISTSSESGNGSGSDSGGTSRESRTDSPDNDSAFSDTVSLLSSASSSASSGVSNINNGKNLIPMNSNLLQVSGYIMFNALKW